MDKTTLALNRSWMNVDQGMGFYLLAHGRESDPNPAAVRSLVEALTDLKSRIPNARLEIANLSAAIQGSTGGLDGLEEAVAQAQHSLDSLDGQLDHAAALLTRQIVLAERLYDLITQR